MKTKNTLESGHYPSATGSCEPYVTILCEAVYPAVTVIQGAHKQTHLVNPRFDVV